MVQLSDGSVAIKARCCGDTSTDTWHTEQNVHKLTPADLQEVARLHTANCEAKHDAMNTALEVFRKFQEGQ